MLRSKVIKGLSWMSASSLFMVCLQVLKVSVLARILGPADFGEMAILVIIIAFIGTFSDLGLGIAIVQKRNLSH